jgi:hypothetical protein
MSVTVISDRYVMAVRAGGKLYGDLMLGPDGTTNNFGTVAEAARWFAYMGGAYKYAAGGFDNAKSEADAWMVDPMRIMSNGSVDEPEEYLVVRKIVTQTFTGTENTLTTTYVRDF